MSGDVFGHRNLGVLLTSFHVQGSPETTKNYLMRNANGVTVEKPRLAGHGCQGAPLVSNADVF